MLCPNCAGAVDDGNDTCPWCRAPLPLAPKPDTNSETPSVTERNLLWRVSEQQQSGKLIEQSDLRRVPSFAAPFVTVQKQIDEISPTPQETRDRFSLGAISAPPQPPSPAAAGKQSPRRPIWYLLVGVPILLLIVLIAGGGVVTCSYLVGRQSNTQLPNQNLVTLQESPTRVIISLIATSPAATSNAQTAAGSTKTVSPTMPGATSTPPIASSPTSPREKPTPVPWTATVAVQPVLPTPTAAPQDSPTPTKKPESTTVPLAPAPTVASSGPSLTGNLEVTEAHHYFDPDGTLHLVGHVLNNTSTPQGGVVVHAVLYDAQDREVGQAEGELLADLDVPGAVAAFDLRVAQPPAFAKYHFWLNATRYPLPQ